MIIVIAIYACYDQIMQEEVACEHLPTGTVACSCADTGSSSSPPTFRRLMGLSSFHL